MKMNWTELEALSSIVESEKQLKILLAEKIDEKLFDLETEMSISYECGDADKGENIRIAADSEREALVSLRNHLKITNDDLKDSGLRTESEAMKFKDLCKVLDEYVVVRVMNSNGYPMAEVPVNEISEFPFDELEIESIVTDLEGILCVRVKYGEEEQG
ncbi:hypothetical protein ACYSNR_03160 [Enterococcus sp. LJL128]